EAAYAKGRRDTSSSGTCQSCASRRFAIGRNAPRNAPGPATASLPFSTPRGRRTATAPDRRLRSVAGGRLRLRLRLDLFSNPAVSLQAQCGSASCCRESTSKAHPKTIFTKRKTHPLGSRKIGGAVARNFLRCRHFLP